MKQIWENYARVDEADGNDRVGMMILVRCTRGGKSRALREIENALWEGKGKKNKVLLIRISCNDYSSIEDWEQDDPCRALCRRIAFVVKNRDKDSEALKEAWEGFNKTASKSVIDEWLGDEPCILMVDELNQLKALTKEEENEKITPEEKRKRITSTKECVLWMKKKFMGKLNRYAVFTSHNISTANKLEDYLDPQTSDGKSLRVAIIEELPLIPDLKSAQQLRTGITALEALCYGLVPALIYKDKGKCSPRATAQSVTQWCVEQELDSDASMKRLLLSFLTGEDFSLDPIRQFMSVFTNESGMRRLLWIPSLMQAVLEVFGDSGRISFSHILTSIADLFHTMRISKVESGDGWESLFIVVLLIRCVTGRFCDVFSPGQDFLNCSVSYNLLLKHSKGKWDDLKTVTQLQGMMTQPHDFPHIAVYFPPNAKFQRVDVVVRAWKSAECYQDFGYQLKEGKNNPKKGPWKNMECWLIRGNHDTKVSPPSGWAVPGEDTTGDFFGVSGQFWTPTQWRNLKAGHPITLLDSSSSSSSLSRLRKKEEEEEDEEEEDEEEDEEEEA